MGYLYILGCISFTVYGQLMLKWRMNQVLDIPNGILDKAIYLIKLILTDPFVLSGFSAAFIASLFWMAAMSKFDISFAYPFMSLSFIMVMLGAFYLFGEPLSFIKIIGTLVVVGLIIISKG